MYQRLSNLTSILTKSHSKKLINNVFQIRYETTFKNINMAMACFQGVEDRFRGITVDSTKEKCCQSEFLNKLLDSLKFWKENDKRGIWFKVATEQAEWIPILANNGFNFHHAKPGYVTMYRWLPENESCNIPSYAHTMLAVGAVVTNDQNQVLVVKEKHFLTPHWKFPGGIVDPGEDLIPAAIREVKEETNIDAKFDSFLSIRHAHKTQFECSDLYMVIGLTALHNDIKHCPREITAAKWMDIQEFLKCEDASELNKSFLQRCLEYKQRNIKIDCEEGFHQFLKKRYMTYSVVDRNDDNSKL